MIADLLTVALWLVGVGVLTGAIRRAFRQRETPRPAPVNRDVLAPDGPLYDAIRLETRPLAPAEYEAHYRTVAGIWQENPMTETRIVASPLWWDATERKDN